MIYMKLAAQAGHALHIAVLESANLTALMNGKPAVSPDGAVVVAWTPDPATLARRLQEAGANPVAVGNIIDQVSKLPQQPPSRPGIIAQEHLLTGLSGRLPPPPPNYAPAVDALVSMWNAGEPGMSPEALHVYMTDTFLPAVAQIKAAAATGV